MPPSPLTSALFTPVPLGALRLPNRIVMAPMTRLRANAELAPTELVATYYAQRATAGLLVSESTIGRARYEPRRGEYPRWAPPWRRPSAAEAWMPTGTTERTGERHER